VRLPRNVVPFAELSMWLGGHGLNVSPSGSLVQGTAARNNLAAVARAPELPVPPAARPQEKVECSEWHFLKVTGICPCFGKECVTCLAATTSEASHSGSKVQEFRNTRRRTH
jgi:hypothetical protein